MFLDCDGVLADFDGYSMQLLGMTLREYEKAKHTPEGWDILYSHEDFFFNLPLMSDAQELVDGVKALGFQPIILTGVPSKEGSDWAIGQKVRWAEKHFPDLSIICCKSKNKFQHMVQGKRNVLIDDWSRFKPVWEQAGGHFILHTSAKKSLIELKEVRDDDTYWHPYEP